MQNEIAETSWPSSSFKPSRIAQPWRHSIAYSGASNTVRQFNPNHQRRRLLVNSLVQLLITTFFCGLLAVCLHEFSDLPLMTVGQVKTFNALIILLSILLGANLTSSLREYALMLRWRIMATKYRSLEEIDLLLNIESLRKVMKLFWVGRHRGSFSISRTQAGCLLWIGTNIILQVLVALLGLTYNLNTSDHPQRKFGKVSIANLTVIRDVWGDTDPSFSSELGSANYYGIQGQDYNFFNNVTVPGQGKTPSYGTPSTPTIYCSEDWSTMSYYFQDQNPSNPALTLLSRRHITTHASCKSYKVIAGGNGIDRNVTFLDENNQTTTLNAVRVGPGAMTFISLLNSTCGPRCAEIWALQSADNLSIPYPSFFKCNNTLSPVQNIKSYIQQGQSADLYQLLDPQARIFAGAIGWTGFNYTPGDQMQYVRYSTDSWWSPNSPTNASTTAEHIMEYSIEAIAALDINGPRRIVTGYHPETAQRVNVLWRWAGATLGIIPFLQLLVLLCVVKYANTAIIRDASDLSTARLLRPIVEKLGPRGCLLTGKEIAKELPELRLKYGYREPDIANGLKFRNSIGDGGVGHVDLIEEHEELGLQGDMPAGRYDGLVEEDGRRRTACGGGLSTGEVKLRRRATAVFVEKDHDDMRRRWKRRIQKKRARKLKPD